MKYFAPLKTFVVGMGLTLLATLFFPAIFEQQDKLAQTTEVQSGHFWGMANLLTSTRLLVFLTCFGMTLFFTGVAFLRNRD